MKSKSVFTAIAKRAEENEIEGLETDPLDRDDYDYKVAIIWENIHCYEEYSHDPDKPYYHYKGPITMVTLTNGEYYRLKVNFEEFDRIYDQYAAFLPLKKFN